MPWQQLTVAVDETSAAVVEDFLCDGGAVSVTLMDGEDQPVFQVDPGTTPIWQKTQVQGLFEHDADMPTVLASLRQQFPSLTEADMVLEEVQDAEWERVCMQDFKPMRFGQRVWICPSWETPPDPDAVNILLDPGLAFGTGTHPTTALCLEWLDAQDLKDTLVIDYGCGSGILAIAAAKLGARRVIGVDNDPQAILASESNRALNGVSSEVMTVHLPGEAHPQADVLVANILAGPLEELTPILSGLVRPGGKLILSGVLSQQTRSLLRSYEDTFDMSEPVLLNEWVRVGGIRR